MRELISMVSYVFIAPSFMVAAAIGCIRFLVWVAGAQMDNPAKVFVAIMGGCAFVFLACTGAYVFSEKVKKERL